MSALLWISTSAGPSVQCFLFLSCAILTTEAAPLPCVVSPEFDADGLTVTPGFIDMHTHLDAQVGWDQDLSPVSQHGVTTALMGNCGVTFAPCKPEDRELLAGMMETVEDIPRESIMMGLPWDWIEYGDYLDSLDRLGPGINLAGMVGHAAIRFYVMGERAVEEQSTDEERQQMASIVWSWTFYRCATQQDHRCGRSFAKWSSHGQDRSRFWPG